MYMMKRKIRFYRDAYGIAARNFVWDDCLTVSASISFVFLLSIIPFSALFLFLLNFFKDLFLPGRMTDDMVNLLVSDITQIIPFVSRQWIQTHLIDSVGLGSFTTINLLMLPIVSGLLFKALEESFRRIFHLERRHLLKGHIAYAAMSIFAILLFFMGNLIWTLAAETIQPLQRYLAQNPYLDEIYALTISHVAFDQYNLLSALILGLFFISTARLFLTIPIKMHHRIAAAALFALLWILARLLFGYYVQHVTRINVLFGSLSSVCIILLWVFYSSIALLYSVEFMYVLHCGPYKVWGKDQHRKTGK